MFARTAVMRALNRHVERVFNSDRTSKAGKGSMTVPAATNRLDARGF
jgi:hypothetical protein